MTKKKPELPVEEATNFHTDMERASEAAIGSEDAAEEVMNSDSCQTDLLLADSDDDLPDGAPNPDDQTVGRQTDSNDEPEGAEAAIEPDESPPKKPGRKRKSVSKKNESEKTTVSAPGAEASSESKARNRRSVRPIQPIISIDDERTVETDADKAKNDLLDLMESLKTGKILSGSIQGVEKTTDDAIAVIYHGSYKIIIPAKEAIIPPNDYRGQPAIDVHQYLLTKRLGAEVDYIVKGIDPEAGIAVASRLEAMRIKRKQFYLGTDRDGNNLLYAGSCAEARVVSVIRTGIFVDLFGLEMFIPLKELSYQRMMDAAGYFQAGQRVLVRVLSVDRTDKNDIKASASVKQATENPYEKALRRYTVGNRYVGTVSMVDTNGVFVSLDGGIDCLCSYPKRGRPPRGARVTVQILGINKETNRIWGAITHTALSR